jgi:hypothetical protein
MLNLTTLMPALPPVKLPNGSVHQIVPLTAESYEMFKTLRSFQKAVEAGEDVDEDVYLDMVDAVLAKVLPTATPDDLASFGFRVEVKLAPILAAAGRIDDVLVALSEVQRASEGNGEALAGSILPTTPAAPSPDTAAPLDKTG